MRTDEKLKVKIVHEDTAEAFERKLNIVLDNVAVKSIEWNHELGFCAYITYKEEVKTLESATDVFHRDGVYWHCRNCPYLERPSDKRRKSGACKVKPTGETRLDCEACDFFYRQLLSGDLKREDLIED